MSGAHRTLETHCFYFTNISGNPTPESFSKIDQAILDGVDYVVNLERDRIAEKSSTILKLNGDEVQVIELNMQKTNYKKQFHRKFSPSFPVHLRNFQ